MIKLTKLVLSFSLVVTASCSSHQEPIQIIDEVSSEVTSPKVEQKDCYIKKSLGALEQDYTITFKENYALIPVKSNKNYYAQVQSKRKFGCVIFAVKQTGGVLKGTYKTREAQHLVSTCEGKQDYIYTQFENAAGKATFRMQCEKAVYEDQLPEAFAPTFAEAASINFDKASRVAKTVSVCAVTKSGESQSQSVCK